MSTQSNKGTALITGASSGIGATYADRLARRGYDLILVARDRARLDALAERLRAEAGVVVDVLAADLTRRADLLAVERRLRDDPAITMLVNNAGIALSGTLMESDPDKLEQLIQLNIVAVTRLATAAAPGFVARKRGAIINLSSVLALAPELSGGPYSGSKAYVLNFTQVLRRELEGSGVKVQAVLPGATRTEIWERAGIDTARFPASMMMGVDEMVDAALAGFDQDEAVTIPSLPESADWDAFTAARLGLQPNLSRDHAAVRYKAT